MERLSEKAIEICNELHTERLDYECEYLPMIDALNRLAAYEDTGLEPQEVSGLCEMDKRSRMAQMLRWEQAEAEGRLVVLPCKVGTHLWRVTHPYRKEPKATEYVVKNFRTVGKKHVVQLEVQAIGVPVTNWMEYKSFFTTREEAEEALRRANEQNNGC